MSRDAEIERLIDEIVEAEQGSGPVPDWIYQQALASLLVVGFFTGFYVDWQLLHPALLTLYAVVGLVVLTRYYTRRDAAAKVELLAREDELTGEVDDIS